MWESEADLAAVARAQPPRIEDAIRPWIERTPHATALADSIGAWSYGELGAATERCMAWLAAQEVRPGDRVMIVGENCRIVVALFLAALQMDAWPVLTNARLAERELAEIRAHCRPRRVLYEIRLSAPARAHAQRSGAVGATIPGVGEVAIDSLDEETIPEDIEDGPGRVAALVYTSGSSGQPKGVMLTHRGLLYVASLSSAIRKLGPDDRLCGILPVSHIVGLATLTLGTLISGASLHLFTRFNPAQLVTAIGRDRLSILLGNPALFTLLRDYAQERNIERLHYPNLRIISSSGAPLAPAVKAEVERLFGLPLHHGYGMTEASPTIAQIRPGRHRDDCSVGPVLPGTEIRLVGRDGAEVPEGSAGELWVRGPGVMKGYYRDPAATAAVVNAAGWLNTRDIARLDGDHLYIVGRTKELIIRYGFNIAPAEVEAVLNTHPDIRDSAVVGRPGADGNEEIVAFVASRPGTAPTEADVADFAARRLAAYKQPTKIILMTELPMTAGNKVAKQELAALAATAP